MKKQSNFLDKTLSQLENNDWGNPPQNESYIVQSLFKLRHKPIGEFSIEDMRILINQDIGLKYLIPLALDALKKEPLAKGMHYNGDLLCSVLRSSPDFYQLNPDIKQQVERILENVPVAFERLSDIEYKYTKEALEEAVTDWEITR